MDSSHVALVALFLRADGFERYWCDRNVSMGMNLTNLAKMLKVRGKRRHHHQQGRGWRDSVTFMFEIPYRVCDFEMKLMDIDSEHLGIPEIQYDAIAHIPSHEF